MHKAAVFTKPGSCTEPVHSTIYLPLKSSKPMPLTPKLPFPMRPSKYKFVWNVSRSRTCYLLQQFAPCYFHSSWWTMQITGPLIRNYSFTTNPISLLGFIISPAAYQWVTRKLLLIPLLWLRTDTQRVSRVYAICVAVQTHTHTHTHLCRFLSGECRTIGS
jgi:hypothetical protein